MSELVPATVPGAPPVVLPQRDGLADVSDLCFRYDAEPETVLLSEAARLNYTVDRPTGCWLWNGHVDRRNGYGYAWKSGLGGHMQVHRQFYLLHVGPIPAGHQIDHVRVRGCVHRHCVNPAHLEAVTPRENTMRSGAASAVNARKTHCKRGHELAGENLYRSTDGSRQCRACNALKQRRYMARKNAPAALPGPGA